MTEKEILYLFEETGALLHGHFILTSGLHSTRYFQCAKVLSHPDYAQRLCAALAGHFTGEGIDTVVAPAVGGILVAHEVARALGVPALFTEREAGKMVLRRGFSLAPGTRALVVEDVMTTGGSVREVIDLVGELGAVVAGVGCLVDRSGGSIALGVSYRALIAMETEAFSPDDPRLIELGPAIKPGSRALN